MIILSYTLLVVGAAFWIFFLIDLFSKLRDRPAVRAAILWATFGAGSLWQGLRHLDHVDWLRVAIGVVLVSIGVVRGVQNRSSIKLDPGFFKSFLAKRYKAILLSSALWMVCHLTFVIAAGLYTGKEPVWYSVFLCLGFVAIIVLPIMIYKKLIPSEESQNNA